MEKQKSKRRIKRIASTQQNLRLQRISFLVIVGLLTLLGSWKVAFRWTLAGSGENENDWPQQQPSESLSNPQFELTSKEAPTCATLSSPDQVTVTLVTQLSHDRLWMMKYHCQRYPHPMAIAVYSNNTQEEVLQELRDMGCPVDTDAVVPQRRHDGPLPQHQPPEVPDELRDDDENIEVDDDQQRRRRLSEKQRQTQPLLQVAVLDAHTHGSWNDYPVNALRNLALSLVRSTYIMYIDADFWTSEHLYETINSLEIKHALLKDPQLALVIPAFGLFRQCREWRECPEDNIPEMPFTLKDVFHMFENRQGHVFDPTNKGGHGSTDYKGWFQQKSSSLEAISCLQSNRYEPFVMIRYCQDMPPFQAAFSGYGKNKVTWMMQVIASGYVLSQVGGAFLVHYPHLDSNSRQHWNQAPKQLQVGTDKSKEGEFNVRRPKKTDGDLNFQEYKRGQVDKLYIEFRDWLAAAIPEDRTRLTLCESAQDDDGKLWIDPEIKQERKKQKRQHSMRTTR